MYSRVLVPSALLLIMLLDIGGHIEASICIFACPDNNCPYGYIPAGCPRCQCAPNPCLFTNCPSGFECETIPQQCRNLNCPHRAHCIPNTSKGEQPCGCTEEFNPVCARNYYETVNFANECNMKCSLGHFMKLHDGFCHCNCPDYYDPVCGSGKDGKEMSYVNNCWRSCVGASLIHDGMCDCQCPLTSNPVCGNDGQTYINECVMGCAGVSKNRDSPCQQK